MYPLYDIVLSSLRLFLCQLSLLEKNDCANVCNTALITVYNELLYNTLYMVSIAKQKMLFRTWNEVLELRMRKNEDHCMA